MTYYKNVSDGYIVSLSTGWGQTKITEAEYNDLLSIIRTAPAAEEGYVYMLNASTLEWELVEVPPVPPEPDEPTAEEALEVLLGGAE